MSDPDDRLFRTMQTAEDGKPRVGSSNYMLGARNGIDVHPDAEGNVHPGEGASRSRRTMRASYHLI